MCLVRLVYQKNKSNNRLQTTSENRLPKFTLRLPVPRAPSILPFHLRKMCRAVRFPGKCAPKARQRRHAFESRRGVPRHGPVPVSRFAPPEPTKPESPMNNPRPAAEGGFRSLLQPPSALRPLFTGLLPHPLRLAFPARLRALRPIPQAAQLLARFEQLR